MGEETSLMNSFVCFVLSNFDIRFDQRIFFGSFEVCECVCVCIFHSMNRRAHTFHSVWLFIATDRRFVSMMKCLAYHAT